MIEINRRVRTYHINMLKLYVERIRIEKTAITERRDIPGEAREETRVRTVGVQSDQGDHPQATAVRETSLFGASADVAIEQEEDSINEEELLELVGFQQKESIRDVCLGIHLSVRQQDEIMRVLGKYEEIFTEVPGKANIIEHKIDLTDDRPIRCKSYALPYAVREDIREEIKNMMETEIVRESSSPYASPLVIVKKKDGSNQICVDYRKLNRITVTDPEPMTAAEDLFQKLEKCQYYSTIDLSKGYWQIPVAEQDVPKTAFVTPDGCYEFLRMPWDEEFRSNSGS